MSPEKINVTKAKTLKIKWDDDSTTELELKYIRDECPCASCKGETVLLKTYRPPKPSIITPEMFEIKNIEIVGDYAIQITWKDGHNTGIYSWEYLLKLDNDQDDKKTQDYKPLL
jgi:DUF971 family protein